MKLSVDGPMAIPLWINGRAFLTVTEQFFDVCNPESGEVIRRTPLAGATEVQEAMQAAVAAQASWHALDVQERQAFLGKMAALLDQYAGHFARLILEERGGDEAEARAEVSAAVAALSGDRQSAGAGLQALIADAGRPLAAVAEGMSAALRAGATLLLKPSPKAPGAAFALAELSGRAGLPPGVLNLVHGEMAAIEAIFDQSALSRINVAGAPEFLAQLQTLAARHGCELTLI